MKKIIINLLIFIISVILITPAVTLAQSVAPCTGSALECMQQNANRANKEIGLTQDNKPIQEIVVDFVRIGLGVLGVVFMVLIMYGGFIWMTSAGNQDSVSKAKKILVNSTIGLFIVIISYAISIWVFDAILESTRSDDLSNPSIWGL